VAQVCGYWAQGEDYPVRRLGMNTDTKRLCLNVITATAIFIFSTQARSQVVTPGATYTVTLSPAVAPISIAYDIKASKLYGVVENTENHTFLFGSINPQTGIFQKSSGALLPLGSFGNNIGNFSIIPSNPIVGTHARAIVVQNDRTISVDLQSGVISTDPLPAPTVPYTSRYDSLNAILYGHLTSQSLSAINIGTGSEQYVVPYPGYGRQGLPSAIDPYHGLFFLAASNSTSQAGGILYIINEAKGTGSALKMSPNIVGLAFDNSTDSVTSALYAITDNYKLLKIDTNTGGETEIANIYDTSGFNFDFEESSIDANDSFFLPFLGSSLTSADVTTDRSWYVYSPIGESVTTLTAWMNSAGQAMGERDVSLPTGRVANTILDFGQTSKTRGLYGTTFANGSQFLSTSTVQSAVIAFADGWYSGLAGANSPTLRIVVGTNNKGLDSFDTRFGKGATKEHGSAWAVMMSNIASAIARRPYASWVIIIAGMDIEMLYSKSPAVSNWAIGFGSNSYVDYGDAQGCPNSCANGWTADDVITLGGSTFMPEIYSPGGGDAKEWAGLSAFSKKKLGVPLNIVAPLSELTVCIQRPPDCTKNGRIDNSPTNAWLQMIGALQKVLPGSTAAIVSATNIEARVKK
jgi:hypothetical protein